MKLYSKHIKRMLDLIFASMALFLLSPLLLVISILVRLTLGSPVIFRQTRPGKDEKLFTLYKFRSMTNQTNKKGELLSDSQRLTKFGRFLRASSLDELLELINIIKGDMSIVGPRPLSIYYLPHYTSTMRKRHQVRPGLTGLAQVSGRNDLPWDERLALDIEYVRNISFLIDLKIIFVTFFKVFGRSNVSIRGTTSIKDFGPYSVIKEQGKTHMRINDMTYSEIGSYWWLEGDNFKEGNTLRHFDWLPVVDDFAFSFSGRAAISIALQDIMISLNIKKAYVPSYSCVSMLQPFVDYEIPIVFYDVHYDDGFTYHVPQIDNDSVALVMNYFGIETHKVKNVIMDFKQQGAIVIEDITHSMLCQQNASVGSDYYITSLRKWLGIPSGGWVGKRSGSILKKPYLDSNHLVVDKVAGMKEKFAYLTGNQESKERFLLLHSTFENDLIHLDKMLKIDDLSLGILNHTDMHEVIKRRRENVSVLVHGLHDFDDHILRIPKLEMSVDTPIYLPIFLNTENRDSLREFLISRGIYCPIHWPEVMGAKVGIRENELSLVCDQRYSSNDMHAIIKTIHAWYDEIQH